MNRDPHDPTRAEPQPDPVADFFARERAGIRELPAAADHWEGLVREARRPVRRAWPAYLAGAAAVLAVAGGIGYGLASHRDEPATPATAASSLTTDGTPVTGSVTSAPTGAPSSSSSTPPRGTLPAAPVGFIPVSLSNGGGGHVFALGSGRCGATSCVAVVASDDDGQTWTTRSSLPAGAVTEGRRTPDASNQLTGVRFANAQVGYVYGGSTYRTTDGGHTWAPFDVGGRRVLSLETDGQRVWLVTAAACQHGTTTATRGCDDVQVWTAPVDSPRAGLLKRVELAQRAESAWLSLDGHDAYVSVSSSDPAGQSLPLRITSTPQNLTRPSGCAATGDVWVWATANARGSLVALCRAEASPDATYSVAWSGDHGTTWSAASPAPTLGVPGPAGVWLTAVDRDHLVAVTRGLATSSSLPDQPSSLVSSQDGGRGWGPASVESGSRTWSWAGAAGGHLVYALAGTGTGYETSTDSGASFTTRSFRR